MTREYERQRERTWERSKGRCIVCNGPGGQVHHRQGRRIPNPHRLSNICLVCADCHEDIHQHRYPSYEWGYMVRKHGIHTPDTMPIKLHGVGFALLTDTGEIIPQKEST